MLSVRYPMRSAVTNEQCRNAAERGAVTDACRDCDHRAIRKSADDGTERAFYAGHGLGFWQSSVVNIPRCTKTRDSSPK